MCPDLSTNANCTDSDLIGERGCPYTTSACRGTRSLYTHLQTALEARRYPDATMDENGRRLQLTDLSGDEPLLDCTSADAGCCTPGDSACEVAKQCAEGVQGPFCKLCSQWVQPNNSYTSSGSYYFYDKPNQERIARCTSCTGDANVALEIAGLFSIVPGIAICIFALMEGWRRKIIPEEWKKELTYWHRVIRPKTKLKQVYGFLAIACLIDSV